MNDNCPLVSNADQLNTDGDSQGDACDADDDNDGVQDGSDNCPLNSNPSQRNTDNATDGGDACDSDDDNDGVQDGSDNCRINANPDQIDTNTNGIGDACEADDDGDGDPDITDCNDQNPAISNNATELCDGVDNDCDGQVDDGFLNTDGDSLADCLDPDSDNDADPNTTDCAPLNAEIHSNVIHDECDGVDNDCDGVVDDHPFTTGSTYFLDEDGDGYGDTNDFLRLCAPDTLFGYTALQGGDCQDTIPGVNPGATDICGNLRDEDCSGQDAVCQCTPQCNGGRICGSNGCGGFCGACGVNQQCSQSQTACLPIGESGPACDNGTDDDQDGNVDCVDVDCANDPACQVFNDQDGDGVSTAQGDCSDDGSQGGDPASWCRQNVGGSIALAISFGGTNYTTQRPACPAGYTFLRNTDGSALIGPQLAGHDTPGDLNDNDCDGQVDEVGENGLNNCSFALIPGFNAQIVTCPFMQSIVFP